MFVCTFYIAETSILSTNISPIIIPINQHHSHNHTYSTSTRSTLLSASNTTLTILPASSKNHLRNSSR